MRGLEALHDAKLGVAQGMAVCFVAINPGTRPSDMSWLTINRASHLLIRLADLNFLTMEHRLLPGSRQPYPHYSVTPKGQTLADLFT